MQLSYWELKNWFSNVDFTIVGSGIVGLHCALNLREKFPKSKILILEKGVLPQGASTKNAGFACFGSISEIIDDKPYGGYELFLNNDEDFYNHCLQKIPFINDVLKPVFKSDVFVKEVDRFNFKDIFEFQLV